MYDSINCSFSLSIDINIIFITLLARIKHFQVEPRKAIIDSLLTNKQSLFSTNCFLLALDTVIEKKLHFLHYQNQKRVNMNEEGHLEL